MIKDRQNYWKNWNPLEREEKPSLSQGIQPDRKIINLRSSYRKLTLSQVQSLPNISISSKGFWGFFGHGTINHSYDSKSINGDNVVIDHATGLVWHQSGCDIYGRWGKGKGEVWLSRLNNRGYAKYHYWRLPTLEGAASLLESSKKNGSLYIDPIFSKKQSRTWTGDKISTGGLWCVDFYGGQVIKLSKRENSYIRPVRSGK